MFDAYIEALRRSFDFEGRMKLVDFWCYQLFAAIFCLSALVLDRKLTGARDWDPGMIFTLCLIAHIPSLLSSVARRLHDVNKTGWLQLVNMIPGGALYILFLLFQPSDEGPNRFGPPTGPDDTETEKVLMAALNRLTMCCSPGLRS